MFQAVILATTSPVNVVELVFPATSVAVSVRLRDPGGAEAGTIVGDRKLPVVPH
jgi:hypothetical protein